MLGERHTQTLGEMAAWCVGVPGMSVHRGGSVATWPTNLTSARCFCSTHPADAPGHRRRARAAGRKEEEQVCDPLIEAAPDLDRDLDPIPTSTSHLQSSHLHTRQPVQRSPGSDLTSSAKGPHTLVSSPPAGLSLHPASRPACRIPRSTRSRLDTDPSRI